MKEVEKKDVPEVSGGNVLPADDTTIVPLPPCPDPGYPQYPGVPGPGPTWPDPITPITYET